MKRLRTFPIDVIGPLIGTEFKILNASLQCKRLKVLKKDNFTCTWCNLEGKFAAVEKQKNHTPHVNIYGINENGHEVLMTQDHKIPQCLLKGSDIKNSYRNLQTMCTKCNQKKADVIWL